MPEGPEVRRMADQLREYTEGKRVRFVVPCKGGRYEKGELPGLSEFPGQNALEGHSLGLRILDVRTKGKFLYWLLENEWSVWCTMGMSGTWRKVPYHDESKPELWTDKHDAVQFHLDTETGFAGGFLYFNDARHFGTIKLVKGNDKLAIKLATLSFDHLDQKHSTTAVWWYLQDCKKHLLEDPIATVLMDQSIFAGVGNYLRAEILYAVKMSPWVKLKDVTYEQLDAICIAARDIMLKSYESGGATIATYRDANGEKGQYASRFACYGRKTDENGFKVIKEKTSDGRTMHWCPEVQK